MLASRNTKLFWRLSSSGISRQHQNFSKWGRSPISKWFGSYQSTVRNISSEPEKPPKITILFGSQTGTAQSFAQDLGNDVENRNFSMEMMDLDSYDINLLEKDPLLIIVAATYGKGEPTDNAKNFMKWIQSEEAKKKVLKGTEYAVFGLGKSKTYGDRYQAASKMLDEGMNLLGAKRIIQRGEGDDDADAEADFMSWKEKLLQSLDERFSSLVGESKKEAPKQEDLFQFVDKKISAMEERNKPIPSVVGVQHPYFSPIKLSRELRPFVSFVPGKYKGCRNVEFDISGTNIKYTTGDHVGVYASNPPEEVEKLAKRLQVNLDTAFIFDKKFGIGPELPKPCSIRTALSRFVDMNGITRRNTLEALAQYATDPSEKETLKSISSPSGSNEYSEKIVKNGLNILEILEMFKSINIPFPNFLELMLRFPIQSRYYSISTSSLKQPTTIGVTVDVIKFTTPNNVLRHGLCSYYISQLQQSDLAPIFVRETDFKLPKDPKTPIILIGAGSGLAPLWAFVQERDFQKKQGIDVGDTVLAYGCYGQNSDFLYKEEILSLSKSGLIELYTAFSHDQKELIFVQHRLFQNSKRIWELVNKEAHIFICGNGSTLGPGVFNTFIEIAKKEGRLNEEDAKKYIADLQCSKRYHEDLFFNIN